MQELWKLISSPRHLIVFEAAARRGSFTAAARELNVQQPAVSLAIKQLETSLGVALFQREHRKVTLTAAGARLQADTSRALEQVLASAQAVQQMGAGSHVTLNASSAFTHYWMMPRLRVLHAAHPDVDLRLQSSDHEPDIDAENISLAIRRGQPEDWPECHATLIAPEVIYPVAAPQVMAAAIHLRSLPGLLHHRLIHLEEPVRERPSWSDWFAHHGVHAAMPKAGLRLNDYALVLQAAMAGEGISFGWDHICNRLIDQGLLSARRDWAWTTGQGFWLVWSKRRALIPHAEAVRDWMAGQGTTPV